ncbi:MAG: translation initiation factor IF-2 [Acidobacteriaceae bacterium]|nr:translation initiation factor IF-2 [Acidobacteriaceae bacterium]
MSKIRINELARELEVKPNVILDMLAEYGVEEKKTHSSSVDEDVAVALRRRLAGMGESGTESQAPPAPPDAVEAAPPAPPRVVVQPEPPPPPPIAVPVAAPPLAAPPPPAPPAPPRPSTAPLAPPLAARPVSAPVTPAPEAPAPAPPPPPARPMFPLRPPLATGGPLVPPIASTPAPAPAPTPTVAPGPAMPPVRPAAVAPPVAPARPSLPLVPPARPAPAASGARQAMPGPSVPPPAPAAASPAPGAPRPPAPPRQQPPAAMILGTPAPRPAGPAAPAAPRPPAPPPARPAAPAMPAPPPQRPAQAPTRPMAQISNPQRPLVGQPTARPIVPPRPDMVDRLNQLRQAPPAPGAPRPAPPPPARPGSPAPGRPLYQGARPGGPSPRPAGPGQPSAGGRPGGPPMMGRGRPMHPTTPGRIEPAVPPPTTEAGRREPGKRAREKREIEPQEGLLKTRYARKSETPLPAINKDITISEGLTVKELADKLGIKTNLVIKKLVEKKIFATINQTLDLKLAETVAREFGASTSHVSYEEEKSFEVELAENPADLITRAPVVTIMGHVDHGKTSLLDAIRSARVADREAGGITQHIGAYQVEIHGKKIVFIDTPGHEAFTRMRSRGAKVTDVVILVVAADDGVMPQTIEAIDHAKAAGVPIIVAMNKIDKPDANPETIKRQLMEHGLQAEDWGGDTIVVPVSAKQKTNLDLLLENVLLVAEIKNLKANPTRPALGNVLEAKLDRGRGPVATVLVQNGILRVGDFFLCGAVFGKVRAMFDDQGLPIREAQPSTPVEVIGLDSLPEVGDAFQVVTDTAKAKQIVVYREAKARDAAMAKAKQRISLEALNMQMQSGSDAKDLNIIIKTDVGGTAEVLSETLQKLSTDKVRVRVLRQGVGAISEADVLLASASNAIIIGFNVKPDRTAAAVAERERIDVRSHSIIYEVTDEIKKAMLGLLAPVYREIYKGKAEVREIFRITKVGNVAGCYVTDGTITRNSEVRIVRNGETVHTGKISQLKRFKDDASEVRNGYECGISVSGTNDIQVGDILEAFLMERVIQDSLN